MSRSTVALAALALVLSVLTGCVNRAEYAAFVDAASAYREAVGADDLRRVDADPAVPEVSRQNRHRLDLEFGDAIAAARSRSR